MIKKLDHIVITTCKLKSTIEFYKKLGFIEIYENENYSLLGENFMIKLHTIPTKAFPLPKNISIGSIDICFELDITTNQVLEYLKENQIPIYLGPVMRHGFKGQMTSTYLLDPNGNLIELSCYCK